MIILFDTELVSTSYSFEIQQNRPIDILIVIYFWLSVWFVLPRTLLD